MSNVLDSAPAKHPPHTNPGNATDIHACSCVCSETMYKHVLEYIVHVECTSCAYMHSLPCLQAILDIIIQGHKQAFIWMDEWYGKLAIGNCVICLSNTLTQLIHT